MLISASFSFNSTDIFFLFFFLQFFSLNTSICLSISHSCVLSLSLSIYIYICVCVCVRVCVCVCVCVRAREPACSQTNWKVTRSVSQFISIQNNKLHCFPFKVILLKSNVLSNPFLSCFYVLLEGFLRDAHQFRRNGPLFTILFLPSFWVFSNWTKTFRFIRCSVFIIRSFVSIAERPEKEV